MIDCNQYKINYPLLASFANNPNSPTYLRTSKTGKKVVVRKGKRKGQNKIVSASAGVVSGLLAAKLFRRGAANAVLSGIDKGILDPSNINHQRFVGYGGTAGILGSGIVAGTLVYKKLRGDRGKK